MIHVGQLVVCIAQRRHVEILRREHPSVTLNPGSVYTVIGIIDYCPDCKAQHLLLEELLSDRFEYPMEWFRPCRPVNFNRFVAQLFPAVPPEGLIE